MYVCYTAIAVNQSTKYVWYAKKKKIKKIKIKCQSRTARTHYFEIEMCGCEADGIIYQLNVDFPREIEDILMAVFRDEEFLESNKGSPRKNF